MAPVRQIDKVMEWINDLDVITTIAAADQMRAEGHDRHYFSVGRSAAHVISTALLARSSFPEANAQILDILDYGCGHGRVARWIRAMFPDARITGTDYIQDGVTWCQTHFNYIPHVGPIPRDAFDMIWLGSVFTHLPETAVRRIIAELQLALRAGGILIFTTQGRHSARRIAQAFETGISPGPWLTYNLSDAKAAELLAAYARSEYGYVDYPGQRDYGVAIAPISWFIDPALVGDQFCILSAQEKAWDSHQDVVCLMRSPVTSLTKGPLF